MAEIFISYARDDADFAARLREGIGVGGLSTWMDSASMAGGERYTKKIESGIKDATSVVVVVSNSSNESKWVRREVLYAQQLGKRVVPVLASQVKLPIHLIDLNVLDLHKDFNTGFEQLLSALRGQTTGAATVAGKRMPPVHMGKALWLFVGAAVLVVLAVIIMLGGGPVAEVLVTSLIIGGALLAMAWKADDAFSLEFKRDLSLWLDGIDPAAVGHFMQRWPAHFAALFDRVFGKKHLSWRCFFRSSIASLLAFLLCTLFYIQTVPGNWNAFKSGGGNALLLVLLATIFNLLPDYVSLLETRWVIQRMQRKLSLAGQLGWLLVDLIATTAIFFMILAGISLLFGRETELVNFMVEKGLLVPDGIPEFRILAIPVWTTYFTTMWVLLYFLAEFLVRLLAPPLHRTLGFLKYALPIEQHPLRAVGLVMALIGCMGYFLVVLLLASTFGGSVIYDYLEPKMVDINPGDFRMGGLNRNGEPDESTVHTVTITEPFAIGMFEVTFEEYDHFARATERALPDANSWGRGNRPVINVSWLNATAYTQWLSKQTGHHYRLPTEAEWEYAARAGTETEYWWGDDIGKDRANCISCGNKRDNERTVPVDSFAPNKWGLYNTAGNVWEWVQGCWDDDYRESPPTDDSACGEVGSINWGMYVLRGGSWARFPNDLRSASRGNGFVETSNATIGFRLAQDR